VVEFFVIGSLEARGPAGPVALGGAKQRLLLAVLVLRAGELVSRAALVDALWPENPPPSAAQTIESYVSRLRGSLRAAGADGGVIASASGGYRLVREGNRFDYEAFEKLASEALAARERGDPRAAAVRAGEALELWRGPALAGLAEQHALRADAAALEDRRLQVIETRAEVLLDLGQDSQLIAALGAEASRHRARERLQELVMLALYRAGRQAEALEVYTAARDHLAGELGLEPGPALRELHAKILHHDPALAAPGRAEVPTGDTGASELAWRRVPRLHIGLAAAGGALILAAAFLLTSGGGVNPTLAKSLRAPAVGLLDAESGRPRAALPVGLVPSRIAAGLGALWVTSYADGTLLRVDLTREAVTQTVSVGHGPNGVAVAAGDVWIADSLDGRLTRVDGRTSDVVQRIPIGASPDEVAAGAGAIWVSNTGDGTVSRIDPFTGTVLGTTRVGPAPKGIAVGAGAVWVAVSGAGVVARLDQRTGYVSQMIHVGSGPGAIAVGRDGVWVANALDSTVSLIDPASATVVLTRAVSGTPEALAAVGNGVWVAAGDTPLLALLQASGGARTVELPSSPTALATDRAGLIVGVRGLATDHRGGTLVMRTSFPIAQINPNDCCDVPPNVRMLAYDGLLAYSKSPSSIDSLVPDLALAVPAPQADGRIYTFRLRPALRYWTGTPVRASDVRRGLERAARSTDVLAGYIGALPGALACPRRPHCDLRAAVETNDRAGTVTLHLTHPDPELLLALGLPAFAPAPPGGGITPGTGPYRVARFVPGHTIVFERNQLFHAWAPTAQPPGYPDRIVVDSDRSTRDDIGAVLQGRADYTFDTPSPSQLHTIALRSPSQLHILPLPDTDFVTLNTHAAPFDDLRVRQALNLATDRKAIVRLFGGPDVATPLCQILPDTIPGHVPYCPYTRAPSRTGHWTAPDTARARRLVAASGTRGTAVNVLTQPGSTSDEPTARYIVRVLRQLGYHAHLRALPPAERNAAITDYRRPPQIVTNEWIADYPSASQWITQQLSCAAWNPPGRLFNPAEFCDPLVDRWAAEATRLQFTSPVAAGRLWARADRRITNLAPWVPTVTESETDLLSRRVGDYQYVPTIGTLLDQLWVR
jgi:ABC-type transport system substrate-binding protein/DNA-binding SARP family transcriptional activator